MINLTNNEMRFLSKIKKNCWIQTPLAYKPSLVCREDSFYTYLSFLLRLSLSPFYRMDSLSLLFLPLLRFPSSQDLLSSYMYLFLSLFSIVLFVYFLWNTSVSFLFSFHSLIFLHDVIFIMSHLITDSSTPSKLKHRHPRPILMSHFAPLPNDKVTIIIFSSIFHTEPAPCFSISSCHHLHWTTSQI